MATASLGIGAKRSNRVTRQAQPYASLLVCATLILSWAWCGNACTNAHTFGMAETFQEC